MFIAAKRLEPLNGNTGRGSRYYQILSNRDICIRKYNHISPPRDALNMSDVQKHHNDQKDIPFSESAISPTKDEIVVNSKLISNKITNGSIYDIFRRSKHKLK